MSHCERRVFDARHDKEIHRSGNNTAQTPSFSQAKYPEYEDLISRKNTFRIWPTSAPIFASTLAEQGFFYTGEKDRVRCWVCGHVLWKWMFGDNPIEEHARIYPNCPRVMKPKPEEVDPSASVHEAPHNNFVLSSGQGFVQAPHGQHSEGLRQFHASETLPKHSQGFATPRKHLPSEVQGAEAPPFYVAPEEMKGPNIEGRESLECLPHAVFVIRQEYEEEYSIELLMRAFRELEIEQGEVVKAAELMEHVLRIQEKEISTNELFLHK